MQKGQGTIEYLVILAVVIIVSLVVVALITNSTAPVQGVSESQSKTFWRTQPISINDAVVDSEGDGYLIVENKTGESIQLKKVTIGGEEIQITTDKTFMNEKEAIPLTGTIKIT